MSSRAQAEVLVYTLRWCPYCMWARQLLKRKGVSFEERSIDGNAGLREEMERRSGRTSVPQIFIGDTHVGGYDDMNALDRKGGLDPLLFPETPA
ncbi:MAG: glutaredoxin 3 [Halothiobacillaceae bacterium]|nr:glutaredoxin 3 [Halothiobacillaceae bacterium]